MTLNPEETGATLRGWVASIEGLFEEVSEWARENHWEVSRSEADVTERHFGTYQVPVLLLGIPELPESQIVLEPQAVNAGGKGRIKMYASNTLYRVRLLRGAGDTEWTILTDSGIPLHYPWEKQTFTTLAKDLLGAA